MKLKVLDLFSGLGGFSLGLERTGGFETVAFCEIDPFCRQVLAKHWPGVPIHDDIQTLSADWLAEMGAWPDVICGGPPCQDISVAGRGAGLAGERSGLWREYARLIGEIRPAFVIVENVADLLGRGQGDVLGNMASLGYSCKWHCIPASAIGAPHRRDRIWIVAYPDQGGRRIQGHERGQDGGARAGQPGVGGQAVADARGPGLQGAEQAGWSVPLISAADIGRAASQCGWRRLESGMGGTDDGLSAWVHRYPVAVEPWEGDTPRTVGRGYPDRRQRLMGLGNSVVPQIVTLIGTAILEAHR